MAEVPKIVHHRLRAATPAREVLDQTHPDADVLTAFGEQALAASEREGVLQHLVLCADCREVVALALPEIETAIPPMEETEVVVARAPAERRESRFSWAGLSWAHLRWATLAAGIAVAVLVVRPGLERMGKPRTAVNSASNQLLAPAAQPGTASQVASSAQPANSVATNLADKDAARRLVEKRAENAASNVESKGGTAGAESAILGRPRTKVPPPLLEMRLAGNMAASGGNVKQSGGAKEDSLSAGMPTAPGAEYFSTTAPRKQQADKSAISESTVGDSSATVEVAAGASGVTTEDVPSPEPSLIARADAPSVQNAPKIEKAKPAFDETTRDAAVNGEANESQTSAQKTLVSPTAASSQSEFAQLAVTSKTARAMKAATPSAKLQGQSAIWTIADGVLQRSLDGGKTWQPSARAALALLCYANRGQDVWAGGQSGTLLRSADNGATWSAVAVSFNGQSLSSDVIALNLQGPAQIVLSTDTHETWNSADTGKTWEKK